mgnify:CR=1 FL=1
MTRLQPQPSTAPTEVPIRRIPDARRPRLWGVMAEFDTPAAIYHAAEQTRDAGFRWWDTHTPFPVHGLDKAMGIKPTILPWLVFMGGLTGALSGFLLQWFTNASGFEIWLGFFVEGYEFPISGKPDLSIPAWIPVIFELTILLAAFACVFGMLLMNGLPRWYHPLFRSERFARATDDRFFLVIEAKDPQYFRDRTTEFLRSLKPLSIEELER